MLVNILSVLIMHPKASIYAYRNIVIAKTAATPGQWTHYALTRDAAGKLSVFVDGALEATSKRMFRTDVGA